MGVYRGKLQCDVVDAVFKCIGFIRIDVHASRKEYLQNMGCMQMCEKECILFYTVLTVSIAGCGTILHTCTTWICNMAACMRPQDMP